jgi:MoxR-like ATPase
VARLVPLPGAPQGAFELLEREHELAPLDECLEAVRRGSHGRIVLVSGEAGADKTALVRRFAEERAGIAYCSDRGLELFRLYLLAFRARLELNQGRWSEAADSATEVLRRS